MFLPPESSFGGFDGFQSAFGVTIPVQDNGEWPQMPRGTYHHNHHHYHMRPRRKRSGLSSLNQSAGDTGGYDDGKAENYGNGSSPSEPSSFNASFPQSAYSPDFSVFDNASRHHNGSNAKPISVWDYDKLKNCNADTSKRPSSLEYLTYFNCGRVKVDTLPEGKQQVTREFTLVAKENQSIPIAYNGLKFDNAWTFNGTIPGPTMRVTQGDLVKITVVNSMGNNHSHSLHLHSIHPGDMDGIDGKGGAIAARPQFHLHVCRPTLWRLPIPLPCHANRTAHQQGPLRCFHD